MEFSRKASSVHPNNRVSAEFGTPLLHRWPGANAQYGLPWGQRIAMSMYDSRAHELKRLLGMKAACVHGLWPGDLLQLWGRVMVAPLPELERRGHRKHVLLLLAIERLFAWMHQDGICVFRRHRLVRTDLRW